MLSLPARLGLASSFVLCLSLGACSSGSDSTQNLGAGAGPSGGTKSTSHGGSSAAGKAGGVSAGGAAGSTSTGGTSDAGPGGAQAAGGEGNGATGGSAAGTSSQGAGGDTSQGAGGSPGAGGTASPGAGGTGTAGTGTAGTGTAGSGTAGSGTAGTSAQGGQNAGGSNAAGLQVSDDIQIIVEPSDHGDGVVNAMKAATKSIHMVMYLLTDTDTINALIARAAAGVEVKVLLNQTFPPGTTDSNASVYAQLMSHGVSVEWAPAQFTYTHEKCVIIDGSVAWIMTMNLTNSSPTDNREYLAVDSEQADVDEAEALFQGDWANMPMKPIGKLLAAPVNARSGMIALLDTATQSVQLEGEELSDTSIVNELAQLQDGGIDVRVVLEGGSAATSQVQAVATLKQHNVKVVGVTKPYIHAKAIVVDGQRMYVGSANFTAGSLGYNRELGLLSANQTEVTKVATTIAADYAIGTPM